MRRLWFSVHKWLGLIVGLQMLAWMASGLFMTASPIETVRSEHNIAEPKLIDLRAERGLQPIEQALASVPGTITRAELGMLLRSPVWRVDVDGKPAAIIDARTGVAVSPLSEADARALAKADFAGEGEIVSATLFAAEPPIEYRGALPAWQIVFGDESETHLYVSPISGKVIARRSGLWRVYDFFWMLHTMDYDGRDDFNNWLVILVSAAGLMLTITGFAILIYRFWPKLRGVKSS